jgi:hypothetical protein
MVVKTYIPVLITVVLLLGTAGAAAPAAIGIKAGLSWATQDFVCPAPFEYETHYRFGVRAGIYAEFKLSRWLFLDVEAHYVQMGMRYDWWVYSADNRIDYVSLAVLAKAKGSPKSWSPFISIGPRVDIVAAKDVDPWFNSIYADVDRFGLGADIGAGIQKGRVVLEIRQSMTFDDLLPDDAFFDVTNRAFSLLVGVTVY